MNNYDFILENLEFLTIDVSLFNLSIMYPERRNISVIENQNLINLKKCVLNEHNENRHNLIYFTSEQWHEIREFLTNTNN